MVEQLAHRLAHADGPRGSVALRRRPSPAGWVYELFVNGTFVMDSEESSTERRLARVCVDRLDRAATVVVGGLGLGYTVAELLDGRHAHRVGRVEVVELEPAVVDWLRSGLVPDTAEVFADRRLRVHIADIRPWLADRDDRSADAILLDVDNGPDYLVHSANTLIYETDCLARAARVLRPGGMLAIWSASASSTLQRRLSSIFGNCARETLTTRRNDRDFDYFVYTGVAPVASAGE